MSALSGGVYHLVDDMLTRVLPAKEGQSGGVASVCMPSGSQGGRRGPLGTLTVFRLDQRAHANRTLRAEPAKFEAEQPTK